MMTGAHRKTLPPSPELTRYTIVAVFQKRNTAGALTVELVEEGDTIESGTTVLRNG